MSADNPNRHLLERVLHGEVLTSEEYEKIESDRDMGSTFMAEASSRGEGVWELPLESRTALTSAISGMLMSGDKFKIFRAQRFVSRMNCWPMEGVEQAKLLRSAGEIAEGMLEKATQKTVDRRFSAPTARERVLARRDRGQQMDRMKPYAELLDGLGTLLETIGPHLSSSQQAEAKARAHPSWRILVDFCPQLAPPGASAGPILCFALQGSSAETPLFLDWFAASLFEALGPARLAVGLSPEIRAGVISSIGGGSDLFTAARALYILQGDAAAFRKLEAKQEIIAALTAPLEQARQYRKLHEGLDELKQQAGWASACGSRSDAESAKSDVDEHESKMWSFLTAWRTELQNHFSDSQAREYVGQVMRRCEAEEGWG